MRPNIACYHPTFAAPLPDPRHQFGCLTVDWRNISAEISDSIGNVDDLFLRYPAPGNVLRRVWQQADHYARMAIEEAFQNPEHPCRAVTFPQRSHVNQRLWPEVSHLEDKRDPADLTDQVRGSDGGQMHRGADHNVGPREAPLRQDHPGSVTQHISYPSLIVAGIRRCADPYKSDPIDVFHPHPLAVG